MKTQIMNYIRAGYPGIYIVSSEETRIEGEIKAVASSGGKVLATTAVHAVGAPVALRIEPTHFETLRRVIPRRLPILAILSPA